MRSIISSLVMIAIMASAVQAAPVHRTLPMTIAASAPVAHVAVPSPRIPMSGLALVGFALVGATSRSRKMDLSRSYMFEGDTYGPGKDVDVPEGFPDIDGETGDVVWPDGMEHNKARRNQSRARSFGTPPNTGGVNTGESAASTADTAASGETVSGKSAEQLEELDKAKLEKLAERHNVTVERQDEDGNVEEGEPLKRDYVRALSARK